MTIAVLTLLRRQGNHTPQVPRRGGHIVGLDPCVDRQAVGIYRVRRQVEPNVRGLLHGRDIVEREGRTGRQFHQFGVPRQTRTVQEMGEGDAMRTALSGDLPDENGVNEVRRQLGGTRTPRRLHPRPPIGLAHLVLLGDNAGGDPRITRHREIGAPGNRRQEQEAEIEDESAPHRHQTCSR